MTSPLPSLKRTLAAALSLASLVPAWAANTAPSRAPEIARITSERGGYVAWVETADGEVDLAVSVAYPEQPLVAPAFIERHSAAEVFLAVAPPRTALPPALARHEAALGASDEELRARLQRENQEALARIPSAPEATTSASLVAGCTESFRTWVGGVYGDTRCGEPGLAVIEEGYTSDTYCTSGCDYTLGAADKGSCFPALKSCDIVEGSATVLRLRTTTQGSPVMTQKGHRAHFGVANCSGNGPVVFKRQRGANVYTYDVEVGHMLHYYQGTGPLAPAAAENFVTYGQWKEGTPPSGPTYLDNLITVQNNSGTDDRVIACGDIYSRYDMRDISSPTCHGSNVSLCSGSNCTTACFYCSGGTCN